MSCLFLQIFHLTIAFFQSPPTVTGLLVLRKSCKYDSQLKACSGTLETLMPAYNTGLAILQKIKTE